jgi:polyferredoxin/tetratricopeptide (TPR) repeat protein
MSLPVVQSIKVGGHPTKIRHSRASWWRFWVLLAVNAAIAGHVALWLVQSMRHGSSATLSPVEPSESMYTLETGVVNAGFIFFAAAIVATLVFGRFVCGWGCHVVALQDLCSWIMTRLRVKPRPFRSRLLLYVPLGVALYMFVWPTVKREVIKPLAGERWRHVAVWLGEVPQWPGWSNGLIVEGFWKTFPPWYVAIPFLLVCGFGAVYFLGSKGFCTYACPYGGFFGPADLVAAGKIRVTEACEQCGHCTAVCTSNVRVHEEVRDFGMVVNPGCMKCLDCVSVCPNDALYFGLGRPAILARPRDEAARARRAGMTGNWDLSWRGEVGVAAAFVGLLLAFRGFLNMVPLLMALAMAGIGAFGAWKLAALAREKSVRIQSLQLKYKGRLRPAGAVFIAAAAVYLVAAAWSGVVRASLWYGGVLDDRVEVPRERAFAAGFVAEPRVRAAAERAIRLYSFGGPPGASGGDGGIGWAPRPETLVRLAYLSLVCSRPAEAERHLREAIRRGEPADSLVLDLAQVRAMQGDGPEAVEGLLREMLTAHPRLVGVRRVLAGIDLERGRPEAAVRLFDEAVEQMPRDPVTLFNAADVNFAAGHEERAMDLLDRSERAALSRPGFAEALRQLAGRFLHLGRVERALPLIEEAARRSPGLPGVFFDLAVTYVHAGRPEAAIGAMLKAAERSPRSAEVAEALADLYRQAGKEDERARWERRAQELRASREGGAGSSAGG